MRCPKCGFISFDHLTSCAKCGRDISEVASDLQGTSIKVESPMFLSGALAALAEREDYFEEPGLGPEVDAGIDFAMEVEGEEEEAPEMASEAEDVDFSFDEAAESVGMEEPAEKGADFPVEVEAEEETSPEAAEKTFEEIDFMGPVDEEDEGTLEFDLEDFIDDLNDEKEKK